MSEDYWWLGGHIAPTGGKNGASRYKSQAACCVWVLCMANHRAFNFKVSAYYCASLCSSQFFPFMSACHLLPSVCSTGDRYMSFPLLNPSGFFSRWPWFISPSNLIAITVSADISPVYPVPLYLAGCETNAYRQYAHISELSRAVSVGLNYWEVLCKTGNGSATELCLSWQEMMI